MPELTHAAFQASDGASYKISGYVEVFTPNYFVLVTAPDGRSLADDFAGAKRAASEAVQRFDCSRGTETKKGSKYSAEANQWLVVMDCGSGGRKLTGS